MINARDTGYERACADNVRTRSLETFDPAPTRDELQIKIVALRQAIKSMWIRFPNDDASKVLKGAMEVLEPDMQLGRKI